MIAAHGLAEIIAHLHGHELTVSTQPDDQGLYLWACSCARNGLAVSVPAAFEQHGIHVVDTFVPE